jgi:hypothetical protein
VLVECFQTANFTISRSSFCHHVPQTWQSQAFFCGRDLESEAYATIPHSTQELKDRITEEFEELMVSLAVSYAGL